MDRLQRFTACLETVACLFAIAYFAVRMIPWALRGFPVFGL